MKCFWPMQCSCGDKVLNLKAIKFHYDLIHYGHKPLYECKKCIGVRIRTRGAAINHFQRRHKYGDWASVMQLFPVECSSGENHNEDSSPFDDMEHDPDYGSTQDMDVDEDPTSSNLPQHEQPPYGPHQSEYAGLIHDVMTEVTAETINQSIMQMLLTLSTECRITQKGQNIIISFITDLLRDLSALETFPLDQLSKISTAKRRKKYMVESMGLVLPERVHLGTIATPATSSKKRKTGVIQSKVEMLLEGSQPKRSSSLVTNEDKYGYIIPLKKSLGLLLKNDDIYKHIINPGPMYNPTEEDSDDEAFTSDWRGAAEHFIDIFLGLSFDEAEITTPMKQAKTKHKMFLALFELLNIPMRLRRDVTKQLLYICKSSYRLKFKRADEKLLQDLIRLVKASQDGIELIEGSNLKFRIHIVQISADNPAAASILRMKVSGGKTVRPCHRCWVTKDDIQLNDDHNRPRRTLRAHERLCESLLHHKINDTFEEFSKTTGITGRSPLFDIPGFDLTHVTVDPMHVLLEAGILTRVLQFFLAGLVQDGYVGKEVLQNKLRDWAFYNPDGERSTGTLDLNLKHPAQSRISYGAIPLLKLAKELPFIIDEYDKSSARRRLFVKAMRLAVAIMYAPYFTKLAAERLKHVFMEIRETFLDEYPAAWLTNKWHALFHLLEDIQRLGAPRGFSCLQSERKYHTIKQEGVRQAKNVAFTLAHRASFITLNQLFWWGPKGIKSKTLEPKITKMKMSESNDLKIPEPLRNFLTQEEITKGLKRYSVGRFHFTKGSVIELSRLTDEEPVFATIQHIINDPNGVYFVVLKSIRPVYNPLFGYYEIQQAIPARVLLSELELQVTLTTVRYDDKLFVLREYAPFLEFSLN